MNPVIAAVTRRIERRSADLRTAWLEQMQRSMDEDPPRRRLSCGNMAHAIAAADAETKARISAGETPNLGIVSAYNDMLSAHQPYGNYPQQIKDYARELGATAQVAAGVPAMCDGITQGRPGMELSLFSRDVIAMAATVGLSHNVFDANLFLGICDKIVPGMMIAALQFAHLPAVFVPSGPMPSGLPNKTRAMQRQKYAQGLIDRERMLAVESASYHSPGTCTFYGTANSNQVLMEMFGVQLPGSSFVTPGTPLRQALDRESVRVALDCTRDSGHYRPLYKVLTAKSLVNAIVGLVATGGSTNHALHLVAIAAAAGLRLELPDIGEISSVVPLLARIYPNGERDVNQFDAAGGLPFVVRELRAEGLLNEQVTNLLGEGLDAFCRRPLPGADGKLQWAAAVTASGDPGVLAPIAAPFAASGGLRLLEGNLGQAIIKVSAVAAEHRVVEAPARIFDSQAALVAAFERGELFQDVVAVVRFQGPAANGMPELHKLTPLLGVCQDRGFQVALLTDGRMSGASGKIPAAIHLSPEAQAGGAIARLQDGDLIRLDANAGELQVLLGADELAARPLAPPPSADPYLGRGLFQAMRGLVSDAGAGATLFNHVPGREQQEPAEVGSK